MQLPVSREVILSELDAARAILQKWDEAVRAGIPGVDVHAPEEALEEFVAQLSGELLIVTGKCQTLAEVLYGR